MEPLAISIGINTDQWNQLSVEEKQEQIAQIIKVLEHLSNILDQKDILADDTPTSTKSKTVTAA